MEKFPEICIIYPENEKHLGLFKDIEEDNRVKLYCTKRLFHNKYLTKIMDFHLDNKFAQKINIPNKDIWYPHYEILKNAKYVKRVLVMDGAVKYVTFSFLKKLQKKGIVVDLYLINSINAGSFLMRDIKEKFPKFNWNHIFSFDPVDAKEKGYTYLSFNYYSKPKLNEVNKNILYDAYFVGGLKGGRKKEIMDIFKYLKTNGVKCNFQLSKNGDEVVENEEGLEFRTWWKSYEEVIQEVINSNCIIEIMQHGQNGTSLRYLEAVCFNKKLITTNKNIVNYPFYNPKYMRIIEKPEDIDINWIKTVEEINYNYNDEFSPKRLIDFLQK